MNLRQFVSATTLVLAGWLTVTFFHEVPATQYQQQRKAIPARSAERGPLQHPDSNHSSAPTATAAASESR